MRKHIYVLKCLSNYFLPCILILGFILRFYNATYRYTLGDESIRDYLVASVGASTLQFPLTGPFSSAGPFTFGPWYWYHLIVFKMILPVAFSPWVLIGILSTVTIYIYYKIGESLVNKECGLLMAFIVALSPSHVNAAFGLTNPNMIHLYVALAFYLFIISVKAKKPYWVYLLFGFTLGVGANIHYQMLILFVLPLIGLCFKKNDRSNFLICTILGIGISFIPLLYFDINNQWYTLKNFIDYSILNKRNINIPYRWLFYIRDFWPQLTSEIFGFPYIVSAFLLVGTGIGTVYLLIRKKMPIIYYAFLIIFLIVFIYLRFYSREKFFGYMHFLHPLFFIFVATTIYLLIRDFKHKYVLLTGVVVIFSFLMLPKNIAMMKSDIFNVDARLRNDFIQKHYSGGYAVYKCTTDSSEPYVSFVSSTFFLLDTSENVTKPKTKLGLISSKCTESNKLLARFFDSSDLRLEDSSKRIANLSNLSDQEIRKAGYERVDKKRRFDVYVNWWKMQKPM